MGKKLTSIVLALALMFLSIPVLPTQAASGIVNVRVAASADDILVYWNGSNWVGDIGSEWQQVGWYALPHQRLGGGMRFTNIAMPRGAAILKAHLVITARLTDSAVDVRSTIRGENVDDAAAFSTLVNFQNRRGTIVGGANDWYPTKSVAYWSNIGTWSAGAECTSSDIKAVIQEIVNRPGWVSGNSVVIFWDDYDGRSTQTGACRRAGYTYDSYPARAPRLYVEYATSLSGYTYSENRVTEAISSLETQIDVLTETVSRQNSQINALSGLDSRLKKVMSEGFGALGVRLGALEAADTEAQALRAARLDELEKKLVGRMTLAIWLSVSSALVLLGAILLGARRRL